MIATAHGTHVVVMETGTGTGCYVTSRVRQFLIKLERDVSIEILVRELDELVLTKQYDIPLSVIKRVRKAYLEKMRECWFVPINLFTKKLTYKLTQMIRKNPDSTDRRVNKRKTFLKSLNN